MAPFHPMVLGPRAGEINEPALAIAQYFSGSVSQSSIQLFVASLSFGATFNPLNETATNSTLGILTALVAVAIAFLMQAFQFVVVS